ncbi:MAG: hypothetical protein ABR583_04285 [Gaiellaceae bacterium]
MNHELAGATLSEPVVGEPLNRGAFVSKLVLGSTGAFLSGERAYDTVYNENVLVGPAAAVGNTTRAFSRFCSGSLAGPDEGFDRYIYLTNEEEGTPASTFDGLGGHHCPTLGRAVLLDHQVVVAHVDVVRAKGSVAAASDHLVGVVDDRQLRHIVLGVTQQRAAVVRKLRRDLRRHASRRSRYAASRVSGNEMMKKTTITAP